MSFATRKFEFPFEAGEAITFPILSFDYKLSYDKYYIVDGKEFLSRYEIALMACKNRGLISMRKSNAMSWKASTVSYKDGENPSSHMASNVEAPPYFGMWVGKCIPIMKNIGAQATVPAQPAPVFSETNFKDAAEGWTKEFFEHHVDWWFEILPSTGHGGRGAGSELANHAKNGRTVWARWDMQFMWIPWYQKLVIEGLTRDWQMETTIRGIQHFIPDQEISAVQMPDSYERIWK